MVEGYDPKNYRHQVFAVCAVKSFAYGDLQDMTLDQFCSTVEEVAPEATVAQVVELVGYIKDFEKDVREQFSVGGNERMVFSGAGS